MINIYLNAKKIAIEQLQSLNEVLVKNGHVDKYFAVAVNQHFVPRVHYTNTFLNEGDRIDIVFPMQGG